MISDQSSEFFKYWIRQAGRAGWNSKRQFSLIWRGLCSTHAPNHSAQRWQVINCMACSVYWKKQEVTSKQTMQSQKPSLRQSSLTKYLNNNLNQQATWKVWRKKTSREYKASKQTHSQMQAGGRSRKREGEVGRWEETGWGERVLCHSPLDQACRLNREPPGQCVNS